MYAQGEPFLQIRLEQRSAPLLLASLDFEPHAHLKVVSLKKGIGVVLR